jgi:hypothetical protein
MLTLEASGASITGVSVVLTHDIELEGLTLLLGERATVVGRPEGLPGVLIRMHDHHCELKPWSNCALVACEDELSLHAWEPSHGVDVVPPLNERWGAFIHRAWSNHPAVMVCVLVLMIYSAFDTAAEIVTPAVNYLFTEELANQSRKVDYHELQ